MPIKVILFDLFGVLFKDRWKKWMQENEPALRKFAESKPPLMDLGLRPNYPQYYSDLIRVNTDEKRKDGDPIIDDYTFYQILEQASNKPAQDIKAMIHDTTVLNKDIVSIVNDLKKQGYKIGLVANGDQEIMQEFLNAHGLAPLFDAIVTSDEVGKRKPHPSIFNKIATLLNVGFDEMLLIDDSKTTTQSIEQLGIHTIHYSDQDANELQRKLHEILKAL